MTADYCVWICGFQPERLQSSRSLKRSSAREAAASELQLSVKSDNAPRSVGSPSILSRWICSNSSLKLNLCGHLRQRLVSGALNRQLTDESLGYYRSEVAHITMSKKRNKKK